MTQQLHQGSPQGWHAETRWWPGFLGFEFHEVDFTSGITSASDALEHEQWGTMSMPTKVDSEILLQRLAIGRDTHITQYCTLVGKLQESPNLNFPAIERDDFPY